MLSNFSNKVGAVHTVVPFRKASNFRGNKKAVRNLLNRSAKHVADDFDLLVLFKQFSFIAVRSSQISVTDSRIVLSLQFNLTNEYRQHFTLLKGLFALGKTSGISIEADRQSGTFSVTTTLNAENEASTYFRQVFSILEQEIRYRKLLSTILFKEQQYQAEMRELYNLNF